MIAKALVQECPVILLDEPTAFLDIVSCIDIMILLHRLAREDNKAILLSTHNVEQSLVIADSLWLLTRADGLECGVTEDLILNNRMDTLFAKREMYISISCTVCSRQASTADVRYVLRQTMKCLSTGRRMHSIVWIISASHPRTPMLRSLFSKLSLHMTSYCPEIQYQKLSIRSKN